MTTYTWTRHAEWKMQYYRLSKQKVIGVMRRPERVEKGIVGRTIAAMQPISPKKVGEKTIWKQEIWVMYQTKSKKEISKWKMEGANAAWSKLKESIESRREVRIISAWRYPGMTRPGQSLPDEVWQEIHEAARGE